jgi:hypothetical protein
MAIACASLAAPVRGELAFANGFIKCEMYRDLDGAAVTDLTTSQKFTDGHPDAVSWLTAFEAPVNSGDRYGLRLAGLLAPPQTGAYVFFIASDDQSELWLSTDDKPDSKQLIASVTGWTDSREWNKFPDTQNNLAAPVNLQAGRHYYIEALMKEGGGGDNLAVGWVWPGQYVDPNNPPDGLTNITVIAGNYLGAVVELTNSKVTIDQQPTNVTSYTKMRAQFAIAVRGTSDLGSNVTYQWKRNGTNIDGATSATYLTPELTLADNSARFLCVASVPGASTNSQEVTLTVLDSQAPRLHIDTPKAPKTNVALWWETPDPGFFLESVEALVKPVWQKNSEPPSYEGFTARVSVPMAEAKYFRLNHANVVWESLWAESMTPGAASADQTDYELGTIFSVTTPGLIRAIRFYVMAGEGGVHIARLWRNRDETVIGGPYEINCGGVEGWFVFYLPKAVAIGVGDTYTVAVSTGQDDGRVYASSENVVSSPGGNGQSLRYPVAAGVFGMTLGSRPKESYHNSIYFRDVLFQAGEIPTENLITWELDRPVSYGRGGDGTARELGTVFRSSVAGSIEAIRIFAIAAEGGLHTATLWKNSDDTMVGGPYEFTCGAAGGVGASAWFVFSLPTAVAIEPNVDYTVSVSTGTDASQAYAFINQAFVNGGNNGHDLSYNSGAGVWGAFGTRPTQTEIDTNKNCSYLRDVVFRPDGATETETVGGGGAVYLGKAAQASEFGTIFQSSTPGVIKGIRVYAASAESGNHTARLWRNSDRSLIGGPWTLTYGGADGWLVFALTNPVPIDTNVLYTVSVTTGTDGGKSYPIALEAFAAAGSNAKHLSYPALAGVFGTALGVCPTTPTNASFLRDIVFQPVVTKPRATMGNTTDGNFADYITDANSAWINAMRFKASANMTATVIKAKIDSVPGHYQCAVYSDKNSMGDRLLRRTQEKSNPAAAWNEFPLESPLPLKAGQYYWLAIWSDDVNARVYYTSQSGGTLKWAPYAYGEWPDPIALEASGSTYLYCIYAEGTFDE